MAHAESIHEHQPRLDAIALVAPQEMVAQQEIRPASDIEATMLVVTLGTAAAIGSLIHRNKHH